MNIDVQPTSVDAPCTGSISYTSDNCEVIYNAECPVDAVAKGVTLTVSGKSKWSTDASKGTAVEAWFMTNPDGTMLCQGTYDVSVVRQ